MKLKKLFKISSLISIILIIVIAAGLFGYLHYKKPKVHGEEIIKNNLNHTKVYFDDYGIPHIYTKNEADAMRVLGYVHAQDRLWQMELLRRISPGRLSEIFGSKALESDKLFISLGINENSIETVAKIDKTSEHYKLSMAYLDGVNQYLEKGKSPIEFDVLNIKKQPFTMVDIQNIIGYMAFSFAMAHKTDPMLSHIQQKLGDDYLKDFGINGEFFQTQIKNHKGQSELYANLSNQVAQLINQSPFPPFIGSNSWVIGAEKTKNGKVIFANDPHIGFSQPCTWYEAHIETEKFQIYGYYLAGVPFPLLAHNREYAVGLTMFENDDIDFFLEETNPENDNQYKHLDTFKNFETRKLSIQVKDTSNVDLVLKKSINGPIVNQAFKAMIASKPISIYWEYLQGENQLIEALYRLSHVKNFNDFYKNISLIHAPGLNIMYGDAKNNIAWVASGRLYRLHDKIKPQFINEAHQNIKEKRTYLPFKKNPHAINPSWHYVYSANNQPEAIDNYLYPGYYLPQDRAKRIQKYLDNKNDWTRKDVELMVLDHTSDMSAELVKKWIKIIDQSNFTEKEFEILNILNKWQGNNDINLIGPTIYNKWLFEYLQLTFKDELESANFDNFIETHLLKQMFAVQSLNPDSPWWDNVNTPNIKENQRDILTKSFQKTISKLNAQLGEDLKLWQWGKRHTLTHQHPLGSVDLLSGYFNVGPAPIAGGNEVINNMLFSLNDSGQYPVKAGPSTRRIIDFSDVENSVSILPTGQSGVPSSPHYKDQSELYTNGQFRKMKMNKKEIIKTSKLFIFKKSK
jgi:penicillin amidase